mgnify:CR=1 FL=1|jgi:chromosome partitioning protein
MKIIACYSNKGGVGKTATAVNMAYSFAANGQRTLLCDLDPQGASTFYFQVKPAKKLDVNRFLNDKERFVKSIRESDFVNLDILPANMSFRDFDIFLKDIRNSDTRIKKTLKTIKDDYDIVILDCSPNISTLSESIFKVADAILVPVIPTPLSQRTFVQLMEFFQEHGLDTQKIKPFFSMVQTIKALHSETIVDLVKQYPKQFLTNYIPFNSDIEKMGVYLQPVIHTSATGTAALAYQALFDELLAKLR